MSASDATNRQNVIAQSTIIPAIIEQHAEEAAFLWMQRDAAVSDPHYSLKDLAHLDERVEAHIDGLRIAADPGWEICVAALDEPDAGSVFAAAVLAFESGESQRIKMVIELGSHEPESFRELISALGWIKKSQFAAMLTRLINSNDLNYQRLVISASAIRGVDSSQVVEHALNNDDHYVKARALRAIGQFKRRDLASALSRYHKLNAECQFWAAWSTLLLQGVNQGKGLNDPASLKVVIHHATTESPFQMHALQLALRVMTTDNTNAWLQQLAKKANQNTSQKTFYLRTLIIAIGICGDPIYIPTLINQMNDPVMARVAGESFTLITGVDLAYYDLDGDWPDDFEAGPNDDPEDHNVAMDIDQDLPWPNAELLNDWWQQHQNQFNAGSRYLMGKPITIEQCNHVLQNSKQRQRRAAALELALRQPNAPMVNIAAPGRLQLCEYEKKDS